MSTRILAGESLPTLLAVAMKVARMHSAPLALSDLLQLMPSGVTPEDLTKALESNPDLAGAYKVSDGIVVPQHLGASELDDFRARRGRSRDNLSTARWLAKAVGTKGVHSMAVSGSTSYNGAATGDDVDLFCVTGRDEMWPFLARALILTRISRMRGGPSPPICLSCIVDEGYAEGMFSTDRGALFARDALVASVVRGEDTYRRLLLKGSWMERYFPRLYSLRVDYGERTLTASPPPTPLMRALNLFLFATLGTYIRAKARYHNLLLARGRKPRAAFEAQVGKDRLIYQSAKYLELKETYDEIRPGESGPQSAAPDIR